MSRISSNLYAITSLDPITEGAGNIEVMSCLPVDFAPNGLPSDDTRYVSLVMVPVGMQSIDILPCFDRERAFSAQWLTYMWEVSRLG